jgi:UDP-N-acetylmuramoyl-L-alanyl-D-glutamate--2,6-diaminopimelate ligase
VAGGAGGILVTGVCHDSRQVKSFPATPQGSGPLFAAVPGEHVDGHDFIADAVRDGAACVLAERKVPGVSVPALIVEDVRSALAAVSAIFYGEPSKSLTMVGVTGTNGKTTTAYLIESILRAAGFSTGLIGTVNYRYGGKTLPAPHTTPEAPELQRILREMCEAGVTHCVMEVSSHALAQRRVDGALFDAGVFTNLTHEHLDYHHTMEEYFRAKARLFGLLKKGGAGATAVINTDDPWGRRLAEEAVDPLTYGLAKGASLRPVHHTYTREGVKAELHTPAGNIKLFTPLIGEYNLLNVLAAVSVAVALGVDLDAIKRGVEGLKNVPGRLEKVEALGKAGFTAYVDYAHTGDALERALCELDRIIGNGKGRIITVFGCGGDRDRTKRPEMGKAAVTHSNLTIITSDNPRSEDPLSIIAGIEKGVAGVAGVRKHSPGEGGEGGEGAGGMNGRGYMVIPERGEAIRKAVTLAADGDVILVAGKGHEDYQIVKGVKHPFDDLEVVKGAMLAHPGVKELKN